MTVHDWGTDPRPWLVVDPTGPALPAWDAEDVSARLRCCLAVADAVVALHDRGVVHAGIDPGNVVARLDTLATEPRPLLTNVALMRAFRRHFQPADYLDPRYAAPEYSDTDFGCVDAKTDVYGLGAVLSHLVTGYPPFDGGYDDVRSGVLSERPVPPTDRDAAVPDPLDDVLATALAKQKLMRYETATQLRAALRRVCERSGYRV